MINRAARAGSHLLTMIAVERNSMVARALPDDYAYRVLSSVIRAALDMIASSRGPVSRRAAMRACLPYQFKPDCILCQEAMGQLLRERFI
jgi:hypothetical protein